MAGDQEMGFFLALAAAMVVLALTATATPDDHHYKVGDYIPVSVNTMRSYEEPCDVQPFFSMPVCPPGRPIPDRKKTLEEVIAGDCFTNTRYKIRFRVNKSVEQLCTKWLRKDEVASLRYAVKNHFTYQMYCNNITMQVGVGGVLKVRFSSKRNKNYLCRHIHFDAYFLGDQVTDIVAQCKKMVDITADAAISVNFTYSVHWKQGGARVEKPVEHFVLRWTETFYSFVSGLGMTYFWLAVCLLPPTAILTDYMTRYSGERNSKGKTVTGKVDMKNIHGNACTCPPYPSVLGAVLGVGAQILILIYALFYLPPQIDELWCNVGKLFLKFAVIYCVTSFFSGYMAASFHTKHTQVGWKECLMQTGVIYIVPAIATGMSIHQIVYKWITDIFQLDTFLSGFVTWLFFTVGLLIFGGKRGHHCMPESLAVCTSRFRTSRSIPPEAWYTRTCIQILLGGFVPFLAIFWQMDNIYASLWGYKRCGALSTLLYAFNLVIALTAVLSMGYAYLQQSMKDKEWWWRSFFRGGSTAVYILNYGIYFQARKETQLRLSVPFACFNICVCYALFLVLGTVSFYASYCVLSCLHYHQMKARMKERKRHRKRPTP